jgi:MSHA type pilus biogenesis protein MshL
VIINAKIVQVTLSDEHQSGIDWRAISEITPLKLKGAAPGGSVFRQSLSSGAEIFQFGVSLSNFSLLMDAMSRQGKVDILSNPEIATINNQKAIIKAGREDTYWRITTQVDPMTGQKTETASPQTITVGVVLDVTPQISDNGEIIMNIHPSITERAGESVSRLGDTMPILDVRETDTVVKIKSGETIFIAGLMQNKKTEEKSSVPLISRIPLIGRLFRRTKEDIEKTELVIFLTPTILGQNI